MTQRRRFQSIGLLVTVVLSMVLLWALATLVQTSSVAYADEPPPQIQTITVTSSKGTYFHNPGLVAEGGTVYFNSVEDKGAGQVLTVTATCSGTVDSFAGALAFGDSPPTDNDEPWAITYTVEMSAETQSGIVFTVTNAGGFDSAVITFTQDNVAPTVIITDVTDPGYDSAGNELDTNGSNWYDPDNLTAGWYFTSTVTDTLSGLALANASWNHSNDAYDQLTYDPDLDGSGVFTDVADNADGTVTVTLTLTDHVGNAAGDTVVFNIDNTDPTIISPTLIPSSNFLYADGFTLYYGDDMSTGASFSVEGEAQDNGVGPKQAIYSEAFEGAPANDDITSPPHSWAGYYLVLAKDYGSNKTLTVTVSDRVGNSATQIFTYTRDIISPTIVPTTISETSPYLYANGLVLYYSDMMGTSPQDFDVQGTASDDIDGAGFRQVTFTLAFGDTPGPDSSPSWSGRYNVMSSNNGNGNITVTAYDNVGNWSRGVFTYIEDTTNPTVTLTYVTPGGYDEDDPDDWLDADGSNWYNSDNLDAGWYFTSTVTDTLSGLALANASWNHSNDAYDRLTYDPGLDGSGVFTDAADNADGTVTVTLTLTDHVGNPASDTVVFNIDNTAPAITSPYINDFGFAHLHVVDDTTIYYGDDMTGPETFRVQGNAQDSGGVGLYYVAYSAALDESYWEDYSNLASWRRNYTADETSTTSGLITATIYDRLDNFATQIFTYTRDITNPTSVAGSPQYDNGSPIVVTYTNATDTGSGLQWVWLWYKKEAGGTWITSSLSPITGFAGSFNFIPTQGDGTYYFATRTEDNVGNLETEPTGSGDDSTIYDTLSPTVPVSFTYQNDTDSGGDGIQPLPSYYDNTVIQLQWSASTDDGSGLLTYHLGTAPHPTSGSYAEDSPYNVGTSGTYTIYLTAEDRAGNISNDAVTGPITVDIEGPQADINCPSSTTNLSFVVDWSATTDQGPAGLRSTNPYSVSYRVDGGSWQDWITVTVPSTVTATFGPNSPVTVEYSHTYCFRLRAVDKAGNVQDTNGTDCTQTVDSGVRKVFLPIIMTPDPNWGFELGNFTNWQHGGQLAQSVSTAMPHSGSYAALLGSPSYDCDGGVPVGSAWLRRSVTVPSDVISPTLWFWYRIYTQDKNSTLSDQYDLFAVYINGSRVWADANTSDPFGCNMTPPYKDLDWRQGSVSLDAYKGQTIQITFYNYNREPGQTQWGWYNTYTYIDDVSVQ